MNNRGFTLIELLIVIAIIGILAGAVIISLSGSTERATDATNKYQAGQLRTAAIEHFDNTKGSYDGLCDEDTDNDDSGKDDEWTSVNDNFEKVIENVLGPAGTGRILNDDDWGCKSDVGYWYFYFQLKGDGLGYWCVDKNVATQLTNLTGVEVDDDESCEDLGQTGQAS